MLLLLLLVVGLVELLVGRVRGETVLLAVGSAVLIEDAESSSRIAKLASGVAVVVGDVVGVLGLGVVDVVVVGSAFAVVGDVEHSIVLNQLFVEVEGVEPAVVDDVDSGPDELEPNHAVDDGVEVELDGKAGALVIALLPGTLAVVVDDFAGNRCRKDRLSKPRMAGVVVDLVS